MLRDAYKVIGIRDGSGASDGERAVALNTLPWHREEVVEVSETECAVASGSGSLLSLKKLEASAEKGVAVREISKGVFLLENEQLSVKVEDGYITSLYDRKADREVIAKGGKANQLVIFDDKPLYWQAWDVEVYHLDTRKELPASGSTRISEDKAHRVSVVTETKISDQSSVKTTISLSAAVDGQQSSVEVEAAVDWHETMKFLKVEFPVEVRNTEASYDTAFGVVKRPTHYNTSWDMAKFEVCCHKFADLSESNYGISILNDSKYGFATVGSLMRLSLLRSPKAPDAHADMGTHHIRWAILPHQGPLGSTTVRKAYEFNSPLKVVVATTPAVAAVDADLARPPVRLTGDASLIHDTVKLGEDDEDVSRSDSGLPRRKGRSVVLRIFDSLGGRARGTVETSWDVIRVFKTNVLEDDLEEVPLADGKFHIELRPFEVATYRLQL